ncbi:MAG: long-chain fatty acid--CoA ligase [Bacteroidetes bacterium SW_9_63_38]|nr:MAG: long-chain fatty acid--CoA ligase [Bacteroidetes bacterium SW_9_63_38]
MRTNGPPDPPESDGLPEASNAPGIIEAVRNALDQCPPPGEAPATNPWKNLLHDRLHDEALPAVIANDTITPAASLWTGSRLWVQAFREADLSAGDRLVVALPPSTAFVQVLVAALWEGCTVALVPPHDDVPELLDALDARAAVTPDGSPHAWGSDEYAGPRSPPDALRSPDTAPTPDVRFLLRTTGTTDHARWVALSDRNVLSVLASHLPHFSLHDARVLSVLPWTHAFGLVLDFLPALLSDSELIRDPNGGRDPEHLIHLRDVWGATHLSAVPLTIQRLLDTGSGAALLRHLQGGIVGGAPISGPLAEALRDTALRVGYGLTEAAPGVALGPPGTWAAHYLGRPVGCSVEIGDDGELLFHGPNACVGFWEHGTLHRADPDRLVSTGDLAERDGDDLFFRGRKDDSFKLSNGRLVQAGALEAVLKTRFPELSDALVFTPNNTDVAIALCVPADIDHRPSDEDVQDVLGSLGERLVWTAAVAPDSWVTLAKGSVDRDAMAATLTDTYESAS